ncbi:hypothetical protein SYNPS1DRAFT_24934 [Syncephalis pseudoplumigaleata]|uniref:Late embryogenesis abundant protein LEA-2 subgroup domain-containing protein n=1 Tax=Syncephalis pseudoplumigaleata TaxID=1712513 RepID=A0A4P9YV46_9FUNG|nr:hypothetical protein SYNPS1DRAFT_24934 [Syncephalis pseudoplumigaleata]|eukprot:RKP23091.1 hypothetical protein SYNPS1DRAFT_24934 [Syncephalis pseudoplumigaleata]
MAPPTIFSYQERSKPVHRRSCCCCTCLVCVILFVLILVGIGLTLFFLWPRIPDVQYMGLQTVKAPEINEQSFRASYNAIVQIKNPNVVGWTVNRMETLVYDRTTDALIGNGTATDLVIPKKEATNFTLPIDVRYEGNGKDDPEISRLRAICLPGTPMPATIKAQLWIKGLDWIYKPKFNKDITITCPK